MRDSTPFSQNPSKRKSRDFWRALAPLDPRELFLDPTKPFVKPRLIAKVLARKLGFRNLLDVIPLDTSLVRGSHGLVPARPGEGPLFLTDDASRPLPVDQRDVAAWVAAG